MVSRRKILSRSRDELHSDIYFMNEDDDEDIWYSKEKLYRVSEFLKYLPKSLFRNKSFALNEMFQPNASKFAIFYV